LLLGAGANVGVANRYGITPLWLASETGNAAILDRLLKAGAEGRAQGQVVSTHQYFSAGPDATGNPIRIARIGLWDQYGGSMPSGWTRWILEQFEFPFARVFAQELDGGGLHAKYDVLIFVDGAIPSVGAAGGGRGGRGGPELTAADVPPEYRAHLGRLTAERTIPQLRQFVEAGGTIVAIGSSAQNLAAHLQLPVEDYLVEDGKPIPRAKYFVPGSLLEVKIETQHPLAAGMPERANVFFDNSPVFRLRGDSARAIATFESDTPLRSGWAWGQKYLKGGVAAADVALGKGRVILYGPEILQRAQPHGTFKLLFNALIMDGTRRP